ncbi:MAG: GAF domain-containing protein [Burkholderiales bacterium]|nr:GAF domain-containing protein [Burkholderiales bacterium]
MTDHREYWNALDACAAAVREQHDPRAALRAIGAAMDRLIGSRMFTFLRFDFDRFEMERLYCTQPQRYPIGARKPMRHGPWSQCVIDRGASFIANGAHEMRATFGDHRALAELGCFASLCVPVRHMGRTLGTMNLNGDEGRYGVAQAAAAQPFATLAVPAYLTIGLACIGNA